jgi:hypothetical protein
MVLKKEHIFSLSREKFTAWGGKWLEFSLIYRAPFELMMVFDRLFKR